MTDTNPPAAAEPEVLVEGTWFKVADLPEVLGNYMRSISEHGRQFKEESLKLRNVRDELDEIRGRYGDLVSDNNDLSTENEQLSARVGELEERLAKARLDVDGWTVHNRPGGLMLSHNTDADRPTLLGDMHLPLGAVLAFIADAGEASDEH
jgi:hypothetical protein